jgi:hypothetical protein
MQHLDRIKVRHAKDSFFNPDVGSVLPSLDMAHASFSTALSQTPYIGRRHQNHEHSKSKDIDSMISEREIGIVTAQELKGHCERFNS